MTNLGFLLFLTGVPGQDLGRCWRQDLVAPLLGLPQRQAELCFCLGTGSEPTGPTWSDTFGGHWTRWRRSGKGTKTNTCSSFLEDQLGFVFLMPLRVRLYAEASPLLEKRLQILMKLGFKKFRWEGRAWWYFSEALWFWEEEIAWRVNSQQEQTIAMLHP